MSYKEFASEFLSVIERQESRLLSWGFYNGSFDAFQIEEWLTQSSPDLVAFWEAEQAQGNTVQGLLDQLCSETLLHALPGVTGRYRSRFAETVRLLASIRQL